MIDDIDALRRWMQVPEEFRSKILKDYILRGHAVSQRFERLEQRVTETERTIGLVANSSILKGFS